MLEQAILLRRDVPGRRVAQSDTEVGGGILPGQVKRSTLQERLTARGYSSQHLRMYAESGVAVRRIQQRHRNQLWQSDLNTGRISPWRRRGDETGIPLLANRYDGIDFLDKECHFLVLTGLSRAAHLQEKFLMNRMAASILFHR